MTELERREASEALAGWLGQRASTDPMFRGLDSLLLSSSSSCSSHPSTSSSSSSSSSSSGTVLFQDFAQWFGTIFVARVHHCVGDRLTVHSLSTSLVANRAKAAKAITSAATTPVVGAAAVATTTTAASAAAAATAVVASAIATTLTTATTTSPKRSGGIIITPKDFPSQSFIQPRQPPPEEQGRGQDREQGQGQGQWQRQEQGRGKEQGQGQGQGNPRMGKAPEIYSLFDISSPLHTIQPTRQPTPALSALRQYRPLRNGLSPSPYQEDPLFLKIEGARGGGAGMSDGFSIADSERDGSGSESDYSVNNQPNSPDIIKKSKNSFSI